MRKPYPLDQFWQLAKHYDISVIINSDAHKPDDLDNFGGAFELAEINSLKIIADFL